MKRLDILVRCDLSPGLLALNRFGYGPKANGDVQAAARDPRGFVKADLAGSTNATAELSSLKPSSVLFQEFYSELDHDTTFLSSGAGAVPMKADASAGRSAIRSSAQTVALKIYHQEAMARVTRAIDARIGFMERLVAFWSNHFCVSAAANGLHMAMVGSFEREAIRPYVLGNFFDMLFAVESHPSMLYYLDNAQSVGPNSLDGERLKRGLNENLGREILELHTLGVGGGYTQQDVIALAKMMSGWTYYGPNSRKGKPGSFTFAPTRHEPGPLVFMGRIYRDGGVEQARDALRNLSRRAETAQFIATKFAKEFVADDPSPDLVSRLAKSFLTTDGNLRALAITLIESPEAWVCTPGKIRNPYNYIIATKRLLGETIHESGVVVGPLRVMGMPLWSPPGPNGFSDCAEAWVTPEGMRLRLNYAAQVAAHTTDPPDPHDLLARLSGGQPSEATREAIQMAESRQQGLAMLLMSPEMQRS